MPVKEPLELVAVVRLDGVDPKRERLDDLHLHCARRDPLFVLKRVNPSASFAAGESIEPVSFAGAVDRFGPSRDKFSHAGFTCVLN